MEHDVGLSTFENLDDRPLKKAKMSEDKITDEKTTALPAREKLSSQIREEKKKVDDEEQPNEQKQNNAGNTYDYLPQGILKF
jgi:ArsR family metal-binding transcriptional regulator